MLQNKYERLITHGLITRRELEVIVEESCESGAYPEELLLKKGVPKHEIIFCLSAYYRCPVIEFDEGIVISRSIIRTLDPERLKGALWVPRSYGNGMADVIAYT